MSYISRLRGIIREEVTQILTENTWDLETEVRIVAELLHLDYYNETESFFKYQGDFNEYTVKVFYYYDDKRIKIKWEFPKNDSKNECVVFYTNQELFPIFKIKYKKSQNSNFTVLKDVNYRDSMEFVTKMKKTMKL